MKYIQLVNDYTLESWFDTLRSGHVLAMCITAATIEWATASSNGSPARFLAIIASVTTFMSSWICMVDFLKGPRWRGSEWSRSVETSLLMLN
ncbi:hypothetical protein EDD21DRAFT_370015 [Dissophora ornata]|nr:hypothetical protein EDD21DRAFT_370015 [Dissophora ornata]